MVVVLGLLVLLALVVTAVAATGTTAARLRMEAWSHGEARLAAEAGVQRVVFEARRVMTGTSYGEDRSDTSLAATLTPLLQDIPADCGLASGVELGDGETYEVSGLSVQVNNPPDANKDLIDVDMTFASSGMCGQSTATLRATVVLQANRWLLPNDTVLLKTLQYR